MSGPEDKPYSRHCCLHGRASILTGGSESRALGKRFAVAVPSGTCQLGTESERGVYQYPKMDAGNHCIGYRGYMYGLIVG